MNFHPIFIPKFYKYCKNYSILIYKQAIVTISRENTRLVWNELKHFSFKKTILDETLRPSIIWWQLTRSSWAVNLPCSLVFSSKLFCTVLMWFSRSTRWVFLAASVASSTSFCKQGTSHNWHLTTATLASIVFQAYQDIEVLLPCIQCHALCSAMKIRQWLSKTALFSCV